MKAQARVTLAAASALLACLSGCSYLSMRQPALTRTVRLPAAAPSVLIVITDPAWPTSIREAASVVASTARTAEKVFILNAHTGAILAVSTAPGPPAVQVPAPPAPPADHPTSFQTARYAGALRQYTTAVQHAKVTARELQQTELTAWAMRTIANAEARPIEQRNSGVNIDASLDAAAADLSSLHQIGVTGDVSTVIAIVGLGQAAGPSAPDPSAGLQASTVVMDDFPDNSAAEAAWQASLLQAGADRVTLLTGATDDQLASVVRQALDVTITDDLTNVLFGLGQYKLTAAALPQLRQLLQLLTVRYPDATATVAGYTDDLPTPGGNLRLSEMRARAVVQWLISQGVASDRLQAFGYGDADPAAPNTRAGQPVNRRVEVIIDPTMS